MSKQPIKLTPAEFKRMFPGASADTIRENIGGTGAIELAPTPHANKISDKLSNSLAKRNKTPALDGTNAGETESVCRTRICFIGYRVRPLDPDNFAGSVKDLLDGLRHANLIPGDEPWRITLETTQQKVAKFEDERTEIIIELAEP